MAIRNNLKEILKEKGISQTELARRVNVTKGTISNVINERFEPSLELAMVISFMINVPFEDIFYIDNRDVRLADYFDSISRIYILKEYYEDGVISHNTLCTASREIINKFIDEYSDDYFSETLESLTKNSNEEIYSFIKKVLQ